MSIILTWSDFLSIEPVLKKGMHGAKAEACSPVTII